MNPKTIIITQNGIGPPKFYGPGMIELSSYSKEPLNDAVTMKAKLIGTALLGLLFTTGCMKNTYETGAAQAPGVHKEKANFDVRRVFEV